MLIQFIGSDLGGGSVVECGVDDIRIIENGVYGDFNENGLVTSADIIANVGFVFKGDPPATPVSRSDADGNCVVTSADIIYLVNFVFKGGPDPLVPCSCP